MGTIHEFKDDYNIGLLGENLIRDYSVRRTSEGKDIYIVYDLHSSGTRTGCRFFCS